MNPYEPPSTVNEQLARSLRMFRVGVTEVNRVFVSASLGTGVRSYVQTSNGETGPMHRGPAEFEVGCKEKHSIRIVVDGTAKVGVYVDGLLVDDNLFASLRVRIWWLVGLFTSVIAALLMGLSILLIGFFMSE